MPAAHLSDMFLLLTGTKLPKLSCACNPRGRRAIGPPAAARPAAERSGAELEEQLHDRRVRVNG